MAVDFRPLVPPTDDELRALDRLNPGVTVERHADGTLLVSPNGFRGSGRTGELYYLMRVWRHQTGDAGRITDASGGYRLPSSAVYAPDSAYVRAERLVGLTGEQLEKFIDGCPDAAFEIVSESDSLRAQRAKCEHYVAAGSALVVLIDPYRRTVARWLHGSLVDTADAHAVDCGPVMPGFILDAAALFDL
jgi:Uma2 family endonuclease